MHCQTQSHFKGITLHIVVILVVSSTGKIGSGKFNAPIVGDIEFRFGVDNE